MSTIDALTKKLNHMTASLTPLPETDEHEPFMDSSLFTSEEWAEVEQLLAQVTPRIDSTNTRPLNSLSDEELERLEYWLTTEKQRKAA